jgi:hypothetical protein
MPNATSEVSAVVVAIVRTRALSFSVTIAVRARVSHTIVDDVITDSSSKSQESQDRNQLVDSQA